MATSKLAPTLVTSDQADSWQLAGGPVERAASVSLGLFDVSPDRGTSASRTVERPGSREWLPACRSFISFNALADGGELRCPETA